MNVTPVGKKMTLRVDQKVLGKTYRSKPNSGSSFKNWNIVASDGSGVIIQLRGPRYLWNELRVDAWYDLTLEPTHIRASIASDWIIAADPNGYRKKLLMLESRGIVLELGAIILEYAFPVKVTPKLVRTNTTESEDGMM
jgi:hypothetical protein